jgi:NTE family protein
VKLKNTAIILGGGAARGGFEVGILKVLIQNHDINIKTIIATSSGAINGAILSAGIASGKPEQAINTLIDTWTNYGNWYNVLEISLKTLIRRKGLSTSDRLKSLIKSAIEGIITTDLNPIDLKIVLTQLSGHTGFINGKPTTTFEAVAAFNQSNFSTPEQRAHIYQAAVASAAFPGLFAPVDVQGFGACCDGGLVNSVAVKYALESHIDRVIVISPFPAISASIEKFKGVDLVSRFGDIIANERLYRDLVNADKVNHIMERLKRLRDHKDITEEQLKKIEAALDNKKEVEIIQIRPKKKLGKNSFSGLFSRDLRIKYINEGIRTAQEIKF